MTTRRVRKKNTIPLRGEITVTIRREGRAPVRLTVRNTITYVGLNALLTLFAQVSITASDYAPRKLVPGTNATPPTPGDIAMGAPVSAPDQVTLTGPSFTHNTASRELVITGTLATTQANGLTLAEIGLVLNNGTVFARQVHPAFEKDGTMSVTYTWRISTTA